MSCSPGRAYYLKLSLKNKLSLSSPPHSSRGAESNHGFDVARETHDRGIFSQCLGTG